MARIRTVKPEFFKHEDLYIAETETNLPLRLAFIGLWCIADREGRFKWKPNQIKLDVLPYDICDFSRVLDALATRGFIEQYQDNIGNLYGSIPSFGLHQVINNRETQSLILSPSDACVTRDPRGLILLKGKGREGNTENEGREGKELTRKDASNSKPKATATRLPPDWILPDEYRNYCLDKRPNLNVDDVAERFKNYWIAKSGRDATKLDWFATWRNWVLDERGGNGFQTKAQRMAENSKKAGDDFVNGTNEREVKGEIVND